MHGAVWLFAVRARVFLRPRQNTKHQSELNCYAKFIFRRQPERACIASYFLHAMVFKVDRTRSTSQKISFASLLRLRRYVSDRVLSIPLQSRLDQRCTPDSGFLPGWSCEHLLAHWYALTVDLTRLWMKSFLVDFIIFLLTARCHNSKRMFRKHKIQMQHETYDTKYSRYTPNIFNLFNLIIVSLFHQWHL